MPKVKEDKFPPVRVSKELLKETKKFAEDCEEYLSDYIRKAVEMRNAKYRYANSSETEGLVLTKDNVFDVLNSAKNMTQYKTKETSVEVAKESNLDKVLSASQKHPKPNMVKSFMKGDK